MLPGVEKPSLDEALRTAFGQFDAAYNKEDSKEMCNALLVIIPNRDYISRKVKDGTTSLTLRQWNFMQDVETGCHQARKSEFKKAGGGIWDFMVRDPICDIGIAGKLGLLKQQHGRKCDVVSAYGLLSGGARLAFTWQVGKKIHQELRHEKTYPAQQSSGGGGGNTAMCPNGQGGMKPCDPNNGTVSGTTGAVDPMTPNNQIPGVSSDIPTSGAGSTYTGAFVWNDNAPAVSPGGNPTTSGVKDTPNDGVKLPDENQTFSFEDNSDGTVKMPAEPTFSF